LIVSIKLNGKERVFDVEPNTLLLNLIREKAFLTGSKYGCGIGECGACTVHVNGEPVLGCMTLAVDVDGCNVDTIEGLAEGDRLDPIQEAFIEEGAVQCGFCTPGMVMSVKALLMENSSPGEDEIRDYLKGNLCRCTGYVNIVQAVKTASSRIGEKT
jgi:carbon-monoxide dehydrogenase small subunit